MRQPDPGPRVPPETNHSPAGSDSAPEIWGRALGDLRLSLIRATYDTLLPGSRPLAWEPETNAWVIEVRSAYASQWLQARLVPTVRKVLARYTPGLPEPSVAFAVAEPQDPLAATSGEAGRAAQPGTGGRDGEVPVRPPGGVPEGESLDGEEPGRDSGGQGTGRGGGSQSRAGAKAGAAGPDSDPQRAAWKASLKSTDVYVKLKTAFRERALRRLKGAKLSVFLCLVLHMDRHGTSAPGVERIMRETGLSRSTVCSALEELASPSLRLIARMPGAQGTGGRGCLRGATRYQIQGYAWFGPKPAPALYEEENLM